MLLKPTGAVPHVGGQLIEPGEPYYEILRHWIADGARLDLDDAAGHEDRGLSRQPGRPADRREAADAGPGHLRRRRDPRRDPRGVRRERQHRSRHGGPRRPDDRRPPRRGPVLARYEGAYAATTLTVMGDRSGFVWEQPPAYNTIDELVAAKWQRMKILPSGLCTDAEFLRRVYLDLTGLPPTADEVRAFLADTRDTRVKRDELIDQLIGSPEFVEHWTNKWADLLQVNRKFLGAEGAAAFRNWIRDAGRRRTRPTTSSSATILTASGLEPREPAGVVLQDPPRPAGHDGEHDAPVPGRAVQLQQVPRPPVRALDPGPVLPDGRLLRPGRPEGGPGQRRPADRRHGRRGGQAALRDRRATSPRARSCTTAPGRWPPPKFPFAVRTSRRPRRPPRRQELAAWITSTDNPYFAQSYVNRLWGYLLGVGIIEPIDDIRAGNPPTNPELLDYLTQEFIEPRLRRPARDAADLQVADVPALGRDEPVERGRQDQLLARHRPAAAGRSPLRRDLPGDRRGLEDPRRAARHARGGAARLGRRAAQRVPDHLRPAGPRERLRVRAHPAACSSARSWP